MADESPQNALSHISILLSLLLLLSLVIVVRLLRAHHRHHKYLRVFGGPYDPFYCTEIFRIGITGVRDALNGGHFFSSLYSALVELSKRFKVHFVIYTGLEGNVFIYRAEEVEGMMTHGENITKPFIVYDMMFPWLRKGLLTSTGAKWKSRRKMLTPTFHFKILDRFADIMNQHAWTFCEALGKRSSLDVDVVPHVEKLTLNIICETVMGVNLDTHSGVDSVAYLAAIKRIGQLFLIRIFAVYQWPDWLYRLTFNGRELYRTVERLQDFTESIIQQRKRYFEEHEDHLNELLNMTEDNGFQCKEPFLDLLLKEHFANPQMLTIENIREEVDTFMFEGHDTTAMGLSFALFLIGHHDDVQQKLYDEIISVLGSDNESDISIDQVRQLKFLDCVVKESLRLFPSVPIVGRRITKDYQLNGKCVPRGSNVYCFFYALHRDPRYFPDPERFDPERFLPQNTAGRHAYAYVPFSAGPRNCIGQKFASTEEKIILAWIIRRYRLRSLIPRDKIRLLTDMVLRSADGLPVQCIRR